ncbi:MAG: helix-turn-helix domain-containing protein [Erysipelotrichaceae bacterium]
MDVCYNRLWKLLIDHNLKKYEFAEKAGISAPTLAKLGKNENVSMEVLIKICRYFKCQMGDIVEIKYPD